MGRDGAGLAYVVAGLVLEVEEVVCFGIAVVVEEDCRVGGWSLSTVVVDVEGLIGCAAVERRGVELPASIEFGSASVRGSGDSEIYLFWLCVSGMNGSVQGIFK